MENSPDSSGKPGTLSRERRQAPRYSFVATTELTDPEHDSKLTGRITEISRYGCYVDIANAFPVGTLLNVHISCDQGSFFTPGKIIYVQENIGMGVAFLDTPKEQLEILDSWLARMPSASAT